MDQQDGEVGEVIAVADNGALPVRGLAALPAPAAWAAHTCHRRAAVRGWHSGQGTGTLRGCRALPGLPRRQTGNAFRVALSWHCPCPGHSHTYWLRAARRRRWHWRNPGGKGTEGERELRTFSAPQGPQKPFGPNAKGDTFPNSRGNAGVEDPPPARAGSGVLLTSTMSCQNWISTGRLSPATCLLCRKAPSTSSFSTELLWTSCNRWGACGESPGSPGHPARPRASQWGGVWRACCWPRMLSRSVRRPAAHLEDAGAVDVDADKLLLHSPCLDALHELHREVHGMPEPPADASLHILHRWAGERWLQLPHAQLARPGVRVLPWLPPRAQPPQLPAWPRSIPPPQGQLQLCRTACRCADMAASPILSPPSL